jgi:hypothetical protein
MSIATTPYRSNSAARRLLRPRSMASTHSVTPTGRVSKAAWKRRSNSDDGTDRLPQHDQLAQLDVVHTNSLLAIARSRDPREVVVVLLCARALDAFLFACFAIVHILAACIHSYKKVVFQRALIHGPDLHAFVSDARA